MLKTCFGDPHRHDAFLRECADRLDAPAVRKHLATHKPPGGAILEEMSRRATLAWMTDPSLERSRDFFRMYEGLLPHANEAQLERTVWSTFDAYKGNTKLTDGVLDEIIPRMRMRAHAYAFGRRSHRRLRHVASLDRSSDHCTIA